MAIMKKDLQQSALNMAILISLRLLSNGLRYSCGMSFIALNSAEEMKSEKKRVGAIANNSAIPPVSAKLIYTYFISGR